MSTMYVLYDVMMLSVPLVPLPLSPVVREEDTTSARQPSPAG